MQHYHKLYRALEKKYSFLTLLYLFYSISLRIIECYAPTLYEILSNFCFRK